MSRLDWNIAGTRFFEAGVDRGVLYIDTLAGLPWIGLISVEENPSGGEPTPYYIDGRKYLNHHSPEEFEATITAYTYPIEFSQCDGTSRVRDGLFFGQQKRMPFGFSYRTLVGNDVESTGHGYKIHLVYNALVTPPSRAANSFAESIEASDFTWNVSTISSEVPGHAPTSHVIVDSRYTHPEQLADIEDILYGTDISVARLPSPEELIDIFDTPLAWTVVDNGDGSFFVGGPIENVNEIGLGQVILDHPSITVIDEDSFTIDY